jgi:hypothetical protein
VRDKTCPVLRSGSAALLLIRAVLANLMFDVGQRLSTKHRATAGHLVGRTRRHGCFIGLQLLGAAVGVGIVLALYPDARQRAGDVVIPHANLDANTRRPNVEASR